MPNSKIFTKQMLNKQMDNMCNKVYKLDLSDLEQNPNKLDLSDLENNNGGLESSLRNYMMQYFWATFDY